MEKRTEQTNRLRIVRLRARLACTQAIVEEVGNRYHHLNEEGMTISKRLNPPTQSELPIFSVERKQMSLQAQAHNRAACAWTP